MQTCNCILVLPLQQFWFKMSSSKYRHAWNRLHIFFSPLVSFSFSPKWFGGGVGVGGGVHCTNLVWTVYIYIIYICQRDICFLLSKVNNQSHLISNLSHMWTSSQVQKDIRITHLNQWPKNLINKYIHYKSNVLSTFSWLEQVLTPALDIGIAKSGSNLVHSHPSHILCLTPCLKARKSFQCVLPCLVMMYHQTNLDCKSFSISEDLVETIVALALNVTKW